MIGWEHNVLKMMKYDEIKYLRSFIALLVLIAMKFFKQLRPKQLQTVGLKRHHHICMDNIKCSALFTFQWNQNWIFLNVSVSARPNNMYHAVRVFASLYSDALYFSMIFKRLLRTKIDSTKALLFPYYYKWTDLYFPHESNFKVLVIKFSFLRMHSWK